MCVVAIKNPKSEAENRLIQEMHRLRARIFGDRLAWKVRCTSGSEIDRFDKLRPTYVLCLDHSEAVIGCAQQDGLHSATLAMFAGGYCDIVTAADLRLERILRRAGWPLSRLGPPTQINESRSVADMLPADWRSLDLLRPSIYSSNSPKQEAA